MTFAEAVAAMARVSESKSHDYAQAGNRYSNFEFAAQVADEFPDGPDRVFATMLAVKLARLAELLNQQKTPKHESVEDTFLDLCNYGVLWWTWRANRPVTVASTGPHPSSCRCVGCLCACHGERDCPSADDSWGV